MLVSLMKQQNIKLHVQDAKQVISFLQYLAQIIVFKMNVIMLMDLDNVQDVSQVGI